MQKHLILLIVAFAMFMETVDATVINTAIPVMAKSLQVNPIDLKLALISYLLSLAVFIPISGWIADKWGIKKVFMSAVAVFTLSSILCGFTSSLTGLVLARILQGLGGALTLPVGRLIIVRICERHELIAKTSIVVMVASIGMMLGPSIGGMITEFFSWRWIFWVNVPIGVLILIASIYVLPKMPTRKVHALDKQGFVLFGSGLSLLMFGLSLISESNISLVYALWFILIAILLLATYVIHSRKRAHPIIDIHLFETRTFRISVMGNLMARIGFGGAPFLLPLMFQITLKYSPQQAGLLLAPIAMGVLIAKPLSLSILRRWGYKKVLIINTIGVALSVASFALINSRSTSLLIVILTLVYGFLIAIQYTAMNSLAYANLVEEQTSSATSIMSTIQQLAQSFGVAIAAIIIQCVSYRMTISALTLPIFQKTFLIMSLLILLSALIFLQLKPDDGHELIAHDI